MEEKCNWENKFKKNDSTLKTDFWKKILTRKSSKMKDFGFLQECRVCI
jgi:hypothetical protein